MGCQHHWIIEATTADEAEGQCYNCGEVRTFTNLPPDQWRSPWGPLDGRWAPLGEDGLPRRALGEGCYRIIRIGGAE
jgi:hypothetical protein